MTDVATSSILPDLPADAYHRDEVADQPSLSASIASVLCAQSPAHARAAHPRLNPDYQRTEEAKYSVGNAAHAIILEGRDAVEVIHHGDFRTNAAKEDRDNALAAGKIPLLVHVKAEVDQMVAAVAVQLEQHEADPVPFTGGLPEQTLLWSEDGVLCRARLDWLHDGNACVSDLKTTARSASPKQYERNLFSVGGDVQCAFYLRGLKAVTGVDAEWRWVVVETAPPYLLSIISPRDEVLAIGAAKVEHAIRTWRECLTTGEWPGYGTSIHYADAPPWETHWLITEELEETAWAQM